MHRKLFVFTILFQTILFTQKINAQQVTPSKNSKKNQTDLEIQRQSLEIERERLTKEQNEFSKLKESFLKEKESLEKEKEELQKQKEELDQQKTNKAKDSTEEDSKEEDFFKLEESISIVSKRVGESEKTSKTSAIVSVYNRQTISDMGARNLADILKQVPGIEILYDQFGS
ncbi:MAG TPA: Plug domain-containing protein, partial [Leptospiraceae bacterium]|nr:Plug domain-containing protein [Leptospiraceae bacterium]